MPKKRRRLSEICKQEEQNKIAKFECQQEQRTFLEQAREAALHLEIQEVVLKQQLKAANILQYLQEMRALATFEQNKTVSEELYRNIQDVLEQVKQDKLGECNSDLKLFMQSEVARRKAVKRQDNKDRMKESRRVHQAKVEAAKEAKKLRAAKNAEEVREHQVLKEVKLKWKQELAYDRLKSLLFDEHVKGEQERLEQIRREQYHIEQDRLEQVLLDQVRLENNRVECEANTKKHVKVEQERLEQIRHEQYHIEQDWLEQVLLDQVQLENSRVECEANTKKHRLEHIRITKAEKVHKRKQAKLLKAKRQKVSKTTSMRYYHMEEAKLKEEAKDQDTEEWDHEIFLRECMNESSWLLHDMIQLVNK